MSDEEKKAIESLIEIREYANLSSYKDTKINQLNAIDTILNLIEKQSKEIEELEQKEKQAYIDGTNIADKLCNKKWKDKIKAKIEELEKQDRENRMSHNYLVIPVLQSLLEKE